jgi:hypothetical protein
MNNDWDFDHVGLVVTNMDEILYYYPSLGIGVDIGSLGLGVYNAGAIRPVPRSPEEEPRTTTMAVYGKTPTDLPRPFTGNRVPVIRMIENLQVGSLVVECIHGHPERQGMNDDFIRDYGEGISHICYNLPDPEKETARLVKKGIGIVMNLQRDGKIVENYLDTAKFGNIWLSFRPSADKWQKAWQAHNRAHPLTSGWKFRGMGVAVRDLDKTVEYYKFLGVAEMLPEIMLDSSSHRNFKVLGLTGSVARARTRTATVGSVEFDFTQPLEKETTFGEFLSKRGEGVFSLDFTVNDLEKETAELVYKGASVVLSGKPKNGSAFAYFDTRKVGNIMVKLIQAGGN